MTQELDINAHYAGTTKAMDNHIEIDNNELTNLQLSDIRDGSAYDMEWDYLTLGGNNSTTYGTGLSLTYRYKSNFMWKVFVDYDYSKKTFNLTYDPYHYLKSGLTQVGYSLVSNPQISQFITDNTGTPFTVVEQLNPYNFKKDKKMNYFTIGLSFMVNL